MIKYVIERGIAMVKGKFLSAVSAAVFFLSASLFAVDSSCVRCHTDATVMKGLFVPPVMGESEGEG